MKNTIFYTERKPVPAAEAKVYSLLRELNGEATAFAISMASNNEIPQSAIYVLANRLVKRGLIIRDEVEIEISPGDFVTRVVFRIAENVDVYSTKSVKDESQLVPS